MAVLTETQNQTWPLLVPAGSLAGRAPVPLALPLVLIGSRHSANIRISSSRINRAHALIFQSQGEVVIRDLNTRTGTLVDGVAIREARLQGGERISIGPFEFHFQPGCILPPLADPVDLAPAQLQVDGGQARLTDHRIVLIGRLASSDIVIDHESVSTAHAAIFDMDGRRFIRDLGSRSGTLVNDRAIHSMEIRPGDTIRIGPATLRYLQNGEAPAPVEPHPLRVAPAVPRNGKHAPEAPRLSSLRDDWAADDRSVESPPPLARTADLPAEPEPIASLAEWAPPAPVTPAAPAAPSVLDIAPAAEPARPPVAMEGAQSRQDLARFLPKTEEPVVRRPPPPSPKPGATAAEARAEEPFPMPTLPPVGPPRPLVEPMGAPVEPLPERPTYLPVPASSAETAPLVRISRREVEGTTEAIKEPARWGPLAVAVTTLPPTLVPPNPSRSRPRQPNMRDYTPILFAVLAAMIVTLGVLLWKYGMPKTDRRRPAPAPIRKVEVTPSPARPPASPAGPSGAPAPSPPASARR